MFLLEEQRKEVQRRGELDRGPHQFTMVNVPFLRKEFASIFGKGQWFFCHNQWLRRYWD